MSKKTKKRVVIAVLDGLRPDFVVPEIMPVLHKLTQKGARPGRFHSVFPTATRVNATALGSGCYPGANGIVANRFMIPGLFDDKPFHTGKRDHIDDAERHFAGRLVESDTLGEVLAREGRSLAVVSSGSPGTTHMANPRAASLGHVSLCLRHWESGTPKPLADDLLARFGPIAEATFPNSARMRQQTDIFLDGVVPAVNPDVSIVWYNDPDYTFHYCGLGSPGALGALKAVDGEVGRLVDWAAGNGRPTDLIVVSDHGHITAARELPVDDLLAEVGVVVDPGRAEGPLSGVPGYVNFLTCRDNRAKTREAVLEWLVSRSWCGPVFARFSAFANAENLGVQDLSAVRLDHPRTPDLVFLLNGNGEPNERGVPGRCLFRGGPPEGGSIHGGLNPYETAAFFMACGPSFAEAKRSKAPAGIPDVAPTVLDVLGLPASDGMTGRVLAELRAGNAQAPDPVWTDAPLSALSADGRRSQTVRRSVCRGCVYIHSAEVRTEGERVMP